MIPLAFGAPWLLAGLAALPVIWWLLRYTPPRPRSEPFPPLRILLGLKRRDETPDRSPWWLTLLRLVLAAAIILALAEPVWNPRGRVTAGTGPLVLVLDNGWASAPFWPDRTATAARLIDEARDAGRTVLLALTAAPANAEIGPFDAAEAAKRLQAARPVAAPVDRARAVAAVAAALSGAKGATVALMTDGLAAQGDEAAFAALEGLAPANVLAARPDPALVALRAADNGAEAVELSLVRPPATTAPHRVTIGFFDERGRRIGDAAADFAAGEAVAAARLAVPFELRNDIVAIAIDGEHHAGAIRLLDDSQKRRRVGLIAAGDADQAQPLLSPLFYIRRALEPFADLAEAPSADLAAAVPALIERKPAIIVMADVGVLPATAAGALRAWVEGGGTLLRFAGPRLAATTGDDPLLPVRLRRGDRTLGGTLSWAAPQPLAEFPAGPFAGLAPPRDVTVNRQVLAEPGPDLASRTWANLADGTPLVTGAALGKGLTVLFHVTPEATWSNLPISGSFVEMLRRVVQMARNQGRVAEAGAPALALPPFRIVAADGMLGPPPPEARPLAGNPSAATVSLDNPPGLYGGVDGVAALNLLAADAELSPIGPLPAGLPVTALAYSDADAVPLKGPLFALAMALAALDTLAVMALSGLFAGRRAAALVLVAAAALALPPAPVRADDRRPGDEAIIDAITRTRLAYVLTGDPATDAVSRAGLAGLTAFLIQKTALEPGEPAGVDLETDPLDLYPMLYWPIAADAPLPSAAAIARLDAYMKQGGSVVFDTRDELESGFSPDGAATPATERLRAILSGLNVPPLEPVPDNHVLTKAFYLLSDFPGLYAGGRLWVEASQTAETRDGAPVRSGDGVSPILITSNDLAGAWAVDGDGNPLLPTASGDLDQRTMALRAGVNIVMYMLTGNYKSDQVHVPALLERLGQ